MWPEELWITADFYVPTVEKLWLIAVGNQQPQRLEDGKIVSVSVLIVYLLIVIYPPLCFIW